MTPAEVSRAKRLPLRIRLARKAAERLELDGAAEAVVYLARAKVAYLESLLHCKNPPTEPWAVLRRRILTPADEVRLKRLPKRLATARTKLAALELAGSDERYVAAARARVVHIERLLTAPSLSGTSAT